MHLEQSLVRVEESNLCLPRQDRDMLPLHYRRVIGVVRRSCTVILVLSPQRQRTKSLDQTQHAHSSETSEILGVVPLHLPSLSGIGPRSRQGDFDELFFLRRVCNPYARTCEDLTGSSPCLKCRTAASPFSLAPVGGCTTHILILYSPD